MTNSEIKAKLEAAYAEDIANGQPDEWGVVYEAPRLKSAIAELEASGDMEAYRLSRGEQSAADLDLQRQANKIGEQIAKNPYAALRGSPFGRRS